MSKTKAPADLTTLTDAELEAEGLRLSRQKCVPGYLAVPDWVLKEMRRVTKEQVRRRTP